MNTEKFQISEGHHPEGHHKIVNLFCLPFSGGNIYSYRGLEQHKAEFIKIIPIDLPGHGKRLRAPLLTDIHAMVNDVFHQIQHNLHIPSYAIYGHSLGAVLGYLLSQRIVRENLPIPLHLFVSGHQGPSVPFKDKDLHLLPHDEFINKVMAYGGIPEAVAAEKELMDLFVPIMQADFQAISEYTYEEETPLDIPITVMIGLDEDITYDEALKWQEVTTRDITIKQFPGNHFFIFDHFPEIGHILSQTLAKAVSEKG